MELSFEQKKSGLHTFHVSIKRFHIQIRVVHEEQFQGLEFRITDGKVSWRYVDHISTEKKKIENFYDHI